jgi:hypothetical protein
MVTIRPFLCFLAVTVVVACGGPPAQTGPWPKARDPKPLQVAQAEGFVFRLGEGAPPPRAQVAVAAATRSTTGPPRR